MNFTAKDAEDAEFHKIFLSAVSALFAVKRACRAHTHTWQGNNSLSKID